MWCITARNLGDRPRTHPLITGMRLEETDGLAHRRLNVERLDVLPVLLEQRDEEVDACERR